MGLCTNNCVGGLTSAFQWVVERVEAVEPLTVYPMSDTVTSTLPFVRVGIVFKGVLEEICEGIRTCHFGLVGSEVDRW